MVLYTFKVEVKFIQILHQGEKGIGLLKQLLVKQLWLASQQLD